MRHTPGAYAVGPHLLLHQRIYRLTKGGDPSSPSGGGRAGRSPGSAAG
jgi:hypothetical protein